MFGLPIAQYRQRPQLERAPHAGPSPGEGEGREHAAVHELVHARWRERDVVALVRQGYTNKEVAETLFVSVKAVEYHMGNIFSKLSIRSRRELRAPRM